MHIQRVDQLVVGAFEAGVLQYIVSSSVYDAPVREQLIDIQMTVYCQQYADRKEEYRTVPGVLHIKMGPKAHFKDNRIYGP